jgi:hypothetical protein
MAYYFLYHFLRSGTCTDSLVGLEHGWSNQYCHDIFWPFIIIIIIIIIRDSDSTTPPLSLPTTFFEESALLLLKHSLTPLCRSL